MGLVTIGLKGVEYAPLASDGGPGTTFQSIGFTSAGTLSFNEDDPSKKEVNVEESSTPLKVKKTPGAKSITLQIANPDTATLALFRGGTVTTATGKKTYTEDNPGTLEGTFKIIPEEGFDAFIINAGSAYGRFNGGLGKDQELLFQVDIDYQQPKKAGVKVWEAIETVPS